MLSGVHIDLDEGQIADFCHEHAIRKLWLFGSVLRDDFGPESDVDVVVKFEVSAKLSFWDVAEIQEGLAEVIGRPVDLVERDALRNPFRRGEILRTSRLVYAA